MQKQVLSTMKQCNSARAYSSEKLTTAKFDTILRAEFTAPAEVNRQDIHFTVVQEDNPVILFLNAEDEFKWNRADTELAGENMALASGHRMDNKTPYEYDVDRQVLIIE
jgi:hypothetical protein